MTGREEGFRGLLGSSSLSSLPAEFNNPFDVFPSLESPFVSQPDSNPSILQHINDINPIEIPEGVIPIAQIDPITPITPVTNSRPSCIASPERKRRRLNEASSTSVQNVSTSREDHRNIIRWIIRQNRTSNMYQPPSIYSCLGSVPDGIIESVNQTTSSPVVQTAENVGRANEGLNFAQDLQQRHFSEPPVVDEINLESQVLQHADDNILPVLAALENVPRSGDQITTMTARSSEENEDCEQIAQETGEQGLAQELVDDLLLGIPEEATTGDGPENHPSQDIRIPNINDGMSFGEMPSEQGWPLQMSSSADGDLPLQDPLGELPSTLGSDPVAVHMNSPLPITNEHSQSPANEGNSPSRFHESISAPSYIQQGFEVPVDSRENLAPDPVPELIPLGPEDSIVPQESTDTAPIISGNTSNIERTPVAVSSDHGEAAGDEDEFGYKMMVIDNPVMCEECDKLFQNNAALARHMEKHTDQEEGKWICSTCKLALKNDANHIRHIMTVHRGNLQYQCETCKVKFATRKSLVTHRHKLHGIIPETVKRRQNSKRKRQSGELREKKLLLYKCGTCDYDSTCKGNMKRHIQIHKGKRRYVCEDCGKRFNTKHNMQIHETLPCRK